MSPSIGRVATAMVTPFDERGDLDLDAAVELANWLVENGSDGLQRGVYHVRRSGRPAYPPG